MVHLHKAKYIPLYRLTLTHFLMLDILYNLPIGCMSNVAMSKQQLRHPANCRGINTRFRHRDVRHSADYYVILYTQHTGVT